MGNNDAGRENSAGEGDEEHNQAYEDAYRPLPLQFDAWQRRGYAITIRL
jgi:hypothetical protein